jgi:hypothetical protein
MQLIHTSFKKRKAKKPNAKQRELRDEWEQILKKYEPKKPIKAMTVTLKQPKPYIRETAKIPSLPFSAGACTKKDTPVYTGTAMKGIGTMHKSNSVPIFSDEEAVAIATMRRN